MKDHMIVPEELFHRLVTAATALVVVFPQTGQTPDEMVALLERTKDSELVESMKRQLIEEINAGA